MNFIVMNGYVSNEPRYVDNYRGRIWHFSIANKSGTTISKHGVNYPKINYMYMEYIENDREGKTHRAMEYVHKGVFLGIVGRIDLFRGQDGLEHCKVCVSKFEFYDREIIAQMDSEYQDALRMVDTGNDDALWPEMDAPPDAEKKEEETDEPVIAENEPLY